PSRARGRRPQALPRCGRHVPGVQATQTQGAQVHGRQAGASELTRGFVDARLFFAERLAAPVLVPVAGGTAIVFSEPAPSRSDEPSDCNEDAVGIFGLGVDAAVLAVADGVGGHGKGDEASRAALEILAEQLAA